jgi:hypothetical protein
MRATRCLVIAITAVYAVVGGVTLPVLAAHGAHAMLALSLTREQMLYSWWVTLLPPAAFGVTLVSVAGIVAVLIEFQRRIADDHFS